MPLPYLPHVCELLISLNKCTGHCLQVQLAVVTPFECLGTVYNMLAKHGAAAGEEDYQSNGKVKLTLTADADQAESLQQAIADATSGKVQPTLVATDES